MISARWGGASRFEILEGFPVISGNEDSRVCPAYETAGNQLIRRLEAEAVLHVLRLPEELQNVPFVWTSEVEYRSVPVDIHQQL